MLACLPFPNMPLIARHEAPGTRKSRHEEERVHWSFLPFMEPYYYWHFGSWNLIPQTTYTVPTVVDYIQYTVFM